MIARRLKDVGLADLAEIGESNAIMGELSRLEKQPLVSVADGTLIGSEAYTLFLQKNNLGRRIKEILKNLDTAAAADRRRRLSRVRALLAAAIVPAELQRELSTGVFFLADERGHFSSYQKAVAQFFSERAMAERERRGLNHFLTSPVVRLARTTNRPSARGTVATAAQGNRMIAAVRTDPAAAAAKTEEILLFAEGARQGLPAIITKKLSNKRSALTGDEAIRLTRWALAAADHLMRRPLAITWEKFAAGFLVTGAHFLEANSEVREEQFRLAHDAPAAALGCGIGQRIVTGTTRLVRSKKEAALVRPGEIAVVSRLAEQFHPWLRQCAAIIATKDEETAPRLFYWDWGVPAVVGATDAFKIFKNGTAATAVIGNRQGRIYRGRMPFIVEGPAQSASDQPRLPIQLIVSNLERAPRHTTLPAGGAVLTTAATRALSVRPPGELFEALAVALANFYPRDVNITLDALTPAEIRALIYALTKVRSIGLKNFAIELPAAPDAAGYSDLFKFLKEAGVNRRAGWRLALLVKAPLEYSALFEKLLGFVDAVTLEVGGLISDIGDQMSGVSGQMSDAKGIIHEVIQTARRKKRPVTARSPGLLPGDLCEFLIQERVDSIAVHAESFWEEQRAIKDAERQLGRARPNSRLAAFAGSFRFNLLPSKALTMLGVLGLLVTLGGYTCQSISSQGLNDEVKTTIADQMTAFKDEVRQQMLASQTELLNRKQTYQEDGFAKFSLRYPAGWIVSHGSRAVLFASPIKNNGWFRVSAGRATDYADPGADASSTVWRNYQTATFATSTDPSGFPLTGKVARVYPNGQNNSATLVELSGSVDYFDDIVKTISGFTIPSP